MPSKEISSAKPAAAPSFGSKRLAKVKVRITINLPTANPPLGNLQIVKPIVSSSRLRSELRLFWSADNSYRQTGHELCIESQERIQSRCYMCLHERLASMLDEDNEMRGYDIIL
ncbi:hypothetical protein ACFX13_034617 [Malus domestica]